jgi:hypothetical protein
MQFTQIFVLEHGQGGRFLIEDQGKASDLKGGIFGRRLARIPGVTMKMSSNGGKIIFGFK